MSDSIILGNLNLSCLKPNKIQNANRTLNQNLFKNKKSNNLKNELSGKSPDEKKSNEKSVNNFKTSRLFDESSLNIPHLKPIIKDAKHEELFSDENFSDFNLNKMLVACLQQRFNLTKATKVQALTIPVLLNGNDALIKSMTGSGKTLAYSIPLVDCLQSIEPKITRNDGLFALIILPTRELAIQTYDCIDRLLNPFRRIVISLLIGGEKKKSEKARIRKGINIIITTPGRLLDHINRTKNLNLEKLKWLIIDEADRLYEQGFSAIIGQIIECIKNACPNKIQTVLLSATLSEGVKELAGLSLQSPELIDVGNCEQHLENITLPSSLENNYMVVPAKLRLVTMSCIILDSLKRNADKSKIIIFGSCQDVVDFYCCLLTEILNYHLKNDIKVTTFKLHGNMNQTSRTEVFRKFHASNHGILFCTDVASRGLDLPNVDLVVQISCPSVLEDFVHRVGRTARLGKKGQSILILLPSEIKIIEYIQEQLSVNFTGLKMEHYFKAVYQLDFLSQNLHTDQEHLAHLQHLYEKLVTENDEMKQMATKAYQSYIRSYATYPRQLSTQYLPFRQLHFGHIAKSFALVDAPNEFLSRMKHKTFIGKSKKTIVDSGSLKRKAIIPLEERISEFGDFNTTIQVEKKPKRYKRK